MATIHLRNFPTEIKLCKKACKSCGLNIFQGPALERAKKANIFWVGLSAVAFEEDEEKLPLSPLTPSGALIHDIEAPLLTHHSFYKTNLVKCAPIDANKVRYPLSHEMEKCFPNFEWELEHLRPEMVFLLGKLAADFVFKRLGLPKVKLDENFRYQSIPLNNIRFVPVHHPSYILVYKRKYLEKYTRSLQSLILKSKESKGVRSTAFPDKQRALV